MGTIIEAAASATAQHGLFTISSRKLADSAAQLCLERAKRSADELDLLINAGIYHDKLMNEPAFAALIQEDIGANTDHPRSVGHGTFSFDVANGTCGVLTGIQLVDGMLASGTAELGIVVTSDVNPQPGVSEGFTFPAVGGAVLLRSDAHRVGFAGFEFATFPDLAELFQAHVDWRPQARRGLAHHGRNVLTVEVRDEYAVQAVDCAESTTRALATRHGLDLAEVDALVATAAVPGFAAGLAARLGVDSGRVAHAGGELESAHTAAPAVLLESIGGTEGRTVLIVSVGAGVTVAAALYRG